MNANKLSDSELLESFNENDSMELMSEIGSRVIDNHLSDRKTFKF